MIVDERMVTYINSLDPGNTRFLEELEIAARSAQVPVIRREMQSFLKFLLELRRPKHILEVGAAVGFSAILLGQYSPEETRITTMESDPDRAAGARENIRLVGMSEKITLLEGDAAELLPALDGSYDLIFMDAAKGQYIYFLPEALRLLSLGGVLVSDNVLQDRDVIESRFVVERRNRTIYKRMREYLYELKHNEKLTTAILPLGDGAAVSVRRCL